MVDDINEVFCKAADISLSKSRNKISHKSTKKLPKWHDLEINNLKKNLLQKQKLFEKFSRDPIIRGNLFSALKFYRKARKKKIRQYHATLVNQLDTLLEKQPKDYWSL